MEVIEQYFLMTFRALALRQSIFCLSLRIKAKCVTIQNSDAILSIMLKEAPIKSLFENILSLIV